MKTVDFVSIKYIKGVDFVLTQECEGPFFEAKIAISGL
jgi:hypothetical protein